MLINWARPEIRLPTSNRYLKAVPHLETFWSDVKFEVYMAVKILTAAFLSFTSLGTTVYEKHTAFILSSVDGGSMFLHTDWTETIKNTWNP